jgi:hypothetical protein
VIGGHDPLVAQAEAAGEVEAVSKRASPLYSLGYKSRKAIAADIL